MLCASSPSELNNRTNASQRNLGLLRGRSGFYERQQRIVYEVDLMASVAIAGVI